MLTVEQFLELPDEQTYRCELIGGEIFKRCDTVVRHDLCRGLLLERLAQYTSDNSGFITFFGTLYCLAKYDAPVAALSVLDKRQVRQMDPNDFIRQAPLIAIEVVSTESARRIMRKVDIYLKSGSRAVWIFFPDLGTATVYHPDGTGQRLRAHDTLGEPNVLPGFSLPLRELFEPLI